MSNLEEHSEHTEIIKVDPTDPLVLLNIRLVVILGSFVLQ